MALIKILKNIFFLYFQVEVQTEDIVEEEKWTQKPPNLTIASDLEDSDLIRENLLGCGGGKQVFRGQPLLPLPPLSPYPQKARIMSVSCKISLEIP